MNVTRVETAPVAPEPVVTYTVELSQEEYDLVFLAVDLAGAPSIASVPEDRENEFANRFNDLFRALRYDSDGRNPYPGVQQRLGLTIA